MIAITITEPKIAPRGGRDLGRRIQEREDAWIRKFDPASVVWRRAGALEWSDPVQIDGLYIATRRSTAMAIARKAGGRLPSAAEADAMAAVAHHMEPVVVRPTKWMAHDEAIAAHSERIATMLPCGLEANAGKLWISDGTNYGWWEKGAPYKGRNGATLWQPVSPRNHNDWHVDYSQTVRFVRPVPDDPYDGLDCEVPVEEESRPTETIKVVAKGSWRTTPHPLAQSFAQAKDYAPGRPRKVCRGVCLHTAELGETLDAAERLQSWAARGANVSWHFAVDGDSIAQSVLECDTAWTAGPANDDFIHVEIAGYARQSPTEWRDGFSFGALNRLAILVAELCDHYGFPAHRLDAEGLLDGRSGICGHSDVSEASRLARSRGVRRLPWYRKGKWRSTNHGDPGKNFPWDAFLEMVAEAPHG